MSSFFFGDDLFESDDRYDPEDRRFYGCCVALVTNNRDPEKMGRVKLRYPWLDAELESNWARCMQIMTGDGRGWWNIPEIDDEVIVAFEHGDPQFPYVIGHVWNGQDRPPQESLMNADGANDVRMYQSRSGHRLVFDDSGAAHARLVDRTGKNYLRFWNPQNKVEVVATDGDMFYKAPLKRILIEAKNLVINVKDSATVTAGTEHRVDVGENMVVQSGTNTSITAGTSITAKAEAGYAHTSDGGMFMRSSITTILGTDQVAVDTQGTLTFLSLLLMKVGVGVFNAKAPIFGVKTIIAQLTSAGARMNVSGKLATLDGLKITAKAMATSFTAKILVLIKAGEVLLNVPGPPVSKEGDAKQPGGLLESLRQKMAKIKTELERLSNVIASALAKLPPFLRKMVSDFLKDALLDFFGGFLPDSIAQSLASLLSGGGLTGPLADLFGGLEDTDFASEWASFSIVPPTPGEPPFLEPEMTD